MRIGTLLDARAEVEASHAVIDDIDALRDELQDAERGQRGYVITGNEEYLTPYSSAVALIPKTLERLAVRAAGDARETAALAGVRESVLDKLTELADTVDLRRTEGFEAAQRIVDTDRGAADMAAIESGLERMRAVEQTQLDAEQRETAAEARSTRRSILGVALLTAVLTAAGAWWATRQVSRPIAAVTAAARRVATGSRVAGSRSAGGIGGRVVGSRVVGSRVVGSRVAGSRVAGSRVAGSRVVGSRVVGSRSAGGIGGRVVGSLLASRVEVRGPAELAEMADAVEEATRVVLHARDEAMAATQAKHGRACRTTRRWRWTNYATSSTAWWPR
ncbi:CHASE3 domain-containing protein [Dactylosporangium sp. McL0621]|uniref:CHASE3 domain-containing protein n=1 Tax=Dactylosporangium sp. McL0621 TaxID=3415678 RepID=UPI003CF011E9